MKKFLVISLTCVLLVGCSENVELEEGSNKVATDVEENINVEESTIKNVVETETSQDNIDEIVVNNVEDSRAGSKIEEQVEEKSLEMDPSLNEVFTFNDDINGETLYSYYKEIENNHSDEYKNLDLVTGYSDEVSIELPLFSSNKEIFEDKLIVKEISDFPKGTIQFFEEPISGGYLANINFEEIYKLYSGISYSLRYNGKEYPIIVSEGEASFGFSLITLVDDVKSLQNAELLIMNY